MIISKNYKLSSVIILSLGIACYLILLVLDLRFGLDAKKNSSSELPTQIEPQLSKIHKDTSVSESPSEKGLPSHNSNLADLLRQLDEIGAGEGRGNLISTISSSWAAIDPEACYEWAMNLDGHYDRYVALLRISEVLATTGEIEILQRFIKTTPRGDLRDVLIEQNFADLARLDMDMALDLSHNLSGAGAINSAAYDLAQVLMQEYSLSDSRKIIEKLDFGQFRETIEYELISAIAKKDPSEALKLFSESPPGSRQSLGYAMSEIAGQFVLTDPSGAVDKINLYVDEASRDRFLQILGGKWALQDREATMAWLGDNTSIGDYMSKKAMLTGIVESLTEQDFQSLEVEISRIKDTNIRNDLRFTSLEKYSEVDPAWVAKELGTLHASGLNRSEESISRTVGNWLSKDSYSASKWVGELKAGRFRDAAIKPLIANILDYGRDLNSAIGWASQISDDGLRRIELQRLSKMK